MSALQSLFPSPGFKLAHWGPKSMWLQEPQWSLVRADCPSIILASQAGVITWTFVFQIQHSSRCPNELLKTQGRYNTPVDTMLSAAHMAMGCAFIFRGPFSSPVGVKKPMGKKRKKRGREKRKTLAFTSAFPLLL